MSERVKFLERKFTLGERARIWVSERARSDALPWVERAQISFTRYRPLWLGPEQGTIRLLRATYTPAWASIARAWAGDEDV